MEFLCECDLLHRSSVRTSTVLILVFFLLLSLLLFHLHLLLEHTSQIGLFGRLRLLLFILFKHDFLLGRLGEIAVLLCGGVHGRSESISDISGRVGIRRSRFSGGLCTVCILFIHHHWRYVRRESCSQGLDHIKI